MLATQLGLWALWNDRNINQALQEAFVSTDPQPRPPVPLVSFCLAEQKAWIWESHGRHGFVWVAHHGCVSVLRYEAFPERNDDLFNNEMDKASRSLKLFFLGIL